MAFAQRQLSPRTCRCSTTIEKTRTLGFQGITKNHEGVEGYAPPARASFSRPVTSNPKQKVRKFKVFCKGAVTDETPRFCVRRRSSPTLRLFAPLQLKLESSPPANTPNPCIHVTHSKQNVQATLRSLRRIIGIRPSAKYEDALACSSSSIVSGSIFISRIHIVFR